MMHQGWQLANVFVDSNGEAFLANLEYGVPVNAPARPDGWDLAAGLTAQQQDDAQLQLLAADVMRL